MLKADMLRLRQIWILFVIFFGLSGCSASNVNQIIVVEEGKNLYTSTTMDLTKYDIDRVFDELLDALMQNRQDYLQKKEATMVLGISEIEKVGEYKIDTEFMTERLINRLQKTKIGAKMSITRLFAEDTNDNRLQYSRQVRKARDDKEFDQHTTIEEGTIRSANHHLKSRITVEEKMTGHDSKEVTYKIWLTLTNLVTHEQLWNESVVISKVDKERYIKQSSDDITSIKPSAAPQSDLAKSTFDTHFVMGVGGAYLGHLFYEEEKSRNHRKESSKDKFNINYLVRMNMGAMFEFEHLSLNLNALYAYANAVSEDTKSSNQPFFPRSALKNIRRDEQILRVQSQQLGGEALINFLNVVYAGVGAMFDVHSSYATKEEYGDNFNKWQKISSYYPFVKFGLIFHKRHQKGALLYLGALLQWSEIQYAGAYFDAGFMWKF